jgi:hypothetical protein
MNSSMAAITLKYIPCPPFKARDLKSLTRNRWPQIYAEKTD